MSLIIIIGRGHSGTRLMSRTLEASGVFMGAELNRSGDLVPPEDLYEACRVMGRHVIHKGGMAWEFQQLHTMPIDPEFERLVRSYLTSVLNSEAEHRGWKLPETTLIYPWIVRMFPEAYYILWYRDPRDSILGRHLTDDMERFGIPCDPEEDLLRRRAISWIYQWHIMQSTPPPARSIRIRVEDFCREQEETLLRLQEFLGFPLERIPVTQEPIGRWEQSEESTQFDFLAPAMRELGYSKEGCQRI